MRTVSKAIVAIFSKAISSLSWPASMKYLKVDPLAIFDRLLVIAARAGIDVSTCSARASQE